MTGHQAGVARAPLDAAALARALIRPGGVWREIRVVPETGSTNADLMAQARAGAAEGLVLAAEAQTAGRGRLGRSWVSPPRAALTCSVLLRPAMVPPAWRGWLSLLTGVSVTEALHAAAVAAALKWPNDVLIAERKVAGILAEAQDGAVVLGFGLNVTLTEAELPVPTATSLLLQDAACTDRGALLAAILAGLAGRYRAWCADPEAPCWREEYLRWCQTIGRPVRAELPGRAALTGTAVDVDPVGRLMLRTADGLVPVSAGDVLHLR